MTQKRIPEIDIMRCICVLWVVAFSHLTDYTVYDISSPPVIFATRIMLAAMIFVSGMLLGKKDISKFSDCLLFYKSRFFHSYIPFLIACLAALLEKLTIHEWLFKNNTVFIRTLFGISGIVLPAPSTLWFICILFLFYAFTPFILWKKTWKSMLIKCLCIYALFWILHLIFHIFDDRVLLYFPAFVLGLFYPYVIKLFQKKAQAVITFLLCAVLIIAFTVIGWNQKQNLFIQFPISVCGIPFLFLLSRGIGHIKFVSNFLAFLGKSSMCFYLFHRQIYLLLQHFFGETFSLAFAYFVALPVCIITGILLDLAIKFLCKKLEGLFDKLCIPSRKVS